MSAVAVAVASTSGHAADAAFGGAPDRMEPPHDAAAAPSAMLAAVRAIADGPLAAAADAIDRHAVYPLELLRRLGAAGAFAAHLPAGGEDYRAAIGAIAEVSRVCGATGFMMWCHDVCGVYMAASGNAALQGESLARHAAAERLGATGMSNPMKTFAGIEPMLLRARRDDEGAGEGWIVDGTLPWVSNLASDHYFGAVAGVEAAGGDAAGSVPHEIMFLVRCDAPGVELRPCPTFSAMEGTNTYAVRLTGHRIGAAELIADPVRPFVGRIRAAFVLLQCGMGLGVAQGAIDSMWQVERPLGHVNEFLEDRPDALQAELDALHERTMRLAETPFADDPGFVVDVLDARAHASEIALRAAQSALLHHGARGFLMSSPVQRRVRESHFVAIVTPALKHLRKEIARLSADVLPER